MSVWLYDFAAVVCLVLIANGAPVLATHSAPRWLAYPLDFGLCLRDGRRLLGVSKTWRGLIASLLVTAIAAVLLGLPWIIGALAAAAAMLGDLSSSFLKRRLGIGSGDSALGLDQVPEALFPALALMRPLGLSGAEVAGIVLLFFVLGIPLSLLLYRLGLRKRRL